jgi:murein DD-endopeptidase MepM/ murein hydrolase activator NlpD
MLLTILLNYNLPEGSLASLISNPHKEFDLRKIKAGNHYTVFLDKDTLSTLRYLVYEQTPVDFIRISFGDTVCIYKGHKNVVQIQKTANGVITTSLWKSMKEKGYSPELILQLSEIYAWTVDFFGLQPADSFSVVYDEQYVDSVAVGLGRIHAAYFKSNGIGIYAIPFTQDSVESYFDSAGNSLKKAFLKAPLRFSHISSRFSNSRMHPILKIRRPHHGVDYAAPYGTPVQAIGDGRITEVSRGSGGGNMIKIRHNSIYSTSYMHLSGFGPGITNGKYVRQGDVIGYVGSSGLSTGPHLDFRFYKNGSPVNPFTVEAPPVDPVKMENRHAFDSVKTYTINLLSRR